MNTVFFIGEGGREHAGIWLLAHSPHVGKIWCSKGNAGIAQERLTNGSAVECLQIKSTSVSQMIEFASKAKPTLTVIGPDYPLSQGLADSLIKRGLAVFGPTKQGAKIEWSKIYSHRFMKQWQIPSPEGEVFYTARSAKAYADGLDGNCVIKADGLRQGKGVAICHFIQDAHESIDEQFKGKPQDGILIQERLEGMEISLHAVSNGKDVHIFPTSQDHKRRLDGDQGKNTGGMGSYTPTPFVDEALMQDIHKRVIVPWQTGCEAQGVDYRGVLYPGVMLTDEGPKILEFNARFGDPEMQSYAARLKSDFFELLYACAAGKPIPELKWRQEASVCVILCSKSYPDPDSKTDDIIYGLDKVAAMDDVKIFHAHTKRMGDMVLAGSGRILGVTAWGSDLRAAQKRAYEAADIIKFHGKRLRMDIANKGIK